MCFWPVGWMPEKTRVVTAGSLLAAFPRRPRPRLGTGRARGYAGSAR